MGWGVPAFTVEHTYEGANEGHVIMLGRQVLEKLT